jgi:hypothetical protein
MTVDESRPVVLYRHVEGITTGMDVEWSFRDDGGGVTHVRIVHAWDEGPRWPLPGFLRRAVARSVIGPVFIHHVASRTLGGIKRAVEEGRSRGTGVTI